MAFEPITGQHISAMLYLLVDCAARARVPSDVALRLCVSGDRRIPGVVNAMMRSEPLALSVRGV